ncbi:3-hydroxybutyryl-CoA dehydrogenase [Granulicella pectinivorans]|jgi:3-hydroxybutyryl-CoA dehydrogenase|uniref:3-hydroxybutyryl-CoA dehydrogenase n=1 Tax=Granulicella pectinivorans TaxID=474950 RepID=A0A1I6L4W8_9BACT|nr:3-hydroxyacyl-CoA dehydrogenase family protein [Granulicella pectinivorans]SFR98474.1 3-hydroxybutyryl-CoA dehydrogenase [Granulicella pectinivorans]
MQEQTVGLIGLGFMGRGIAGCLIAHGLHVVSYTLARSEFEQAREAIAQAIEELIENAGYDPSLRDEWRGRYVEAASLQDVASCTFIIESITESAEAKHRLFADLEAIVSPETPIASNTSALPISLLQQGRLRPERFLGMHWAEPAHCTRFLELIRGEHTNDASLQAAERIALQLRKDPCIVQQDIPGFIVNRIAYAMYREACNLLHLGIADADTIDKAFRNSCGLWAGICGPLRWIDLTGGPALYGKTMTGVLPTLYNSPELPEPIASLMKAGATGIKSGQGFFSYTPEEAQAWEKIYRDQVWRMRAIAEEVFPISDHEPKTP